MEEQRTEVQETDTRVNDPVVQRQTVAHTTERVSSAVVAQRVVWFIVGVIDALIAIRFVLLLLGANHDAGFVDFIYSVTNVLVAPFTGIFGQPTYGVSVFEISSLLAILIYTLIGYGIARLLTLTRPRDEI
jgi:hypothetical protein